ncbi:MAG TPA: hypothetical protein VFU86_05940 [Terriglobales bacterium]|jgi:hypothetical protein|nr:hypothetical protein [Terriglobales bacterium]
MIARKAPEPNAKLPDPDDVLRVMLNTPPQPHTTPTAKRKKPATRAKKTPK